VVDDGEQLLASREAEISEAPREYQRYHNYDRK
jgi:hypothetical protein